MRGRGWSWVLHFVATPQLARRSFRERRGDLESQRVCDPVDEVERRADVDRIQYCALTHARSAHRRDIRGSDRFGGEGERLKETQCCAERWRDGGGAPVCQHCLRDGITESV